jgi:hypothetical protein
MTPFRAFVLSRLGARKVARPKPHWKAATVSVALMLLLYGTAAYLVAPWGWWWYAQRHPWLDDSPTVTQTKEGIPGDPLNVALIGTEAEVQQIMAAAGWQVSDRLGLRNDLKIAVDTLAKRPYEKAPVSNLYLFDRKQDLAFEQPAGNNPRRRHHVRFWQLEKKDEQGRPLWLGAITFDARVGFSHTTGQVTHHIAPDVDTERDRLFQQLNATARLARIQVIDYFHHRREGRNGGGDLWYTDGRLVVGVINKDP